MTLKPALNYEDQIIKLKVDHNLKIKDEGYATEILEKVNYYRLSGYGIGLKKYNNKEHYKDDITIEHLFNLYCFDSSLKTTSLELLSKLK